MWLLGQQCGAGPMWLFSSVAQRRHRARHALALHLHDRALLHRRPPRRARLPIGILWHETEMVRVMSGVVQAG